MKQKLTLEPLAMQLALRRRSRLPAGRPSGGPCAHLPPHSPARQAGKNSRASLGKGRARSSRAGRPGRPIRVFSSHHGAWHPPRRPSTLGPHGVRRALCCGLASPRTDVQTAERRKRHLPRTEPSWTPMPPRAAIRRRRALEWQGGTLCAGPRATTRAQGPARRSNKRSQARRLAACGQREQADRAERESVLDLVFFCGAKPTPYEACRVA